MSSAEAVQKIGQYEIVRRLAYGGMGEVFLARLGGADGFSKEVVIKRLLPQYVENADFVSMFRDEARITSRLTHGNIAQLIEFGESDGQYFLVLEYVRGPSLGMTLRALEKRGERLSIPEVAHITIEVSRALDYAHKKLGDDGQPLCVVHRDVSPSNILLSFEGEVKLTDFGIARARERLTPTQAGQVKGKFAYMAPETILRGEVDPRSDLFSLGAVVFESLAGVPAFRSDTEAQTVHRVISEEIVPPSRFNAAIPPEMDAMVLRLLDRDPKGRPGRAIEVVEALGPLCFPSVPPASDLLAETLRRLFQQQSGVVTKELETPVLVATTSRKRVLIIDESRTLRALVKAMIGKRYDVSEASSIEDAKEAMLEAQPDAVICQRNLQGRSALELCQTMRADARLRQIPFVLLAADVSAEFTKQAAAAGVQAVLPKAFDPERLDKTLRDSIARGVGR